ncbi:MAG: hypothetical protein KGQ46_11855 [Hyphomicrobiales bacterium]|nr:hypothetical protein [Hyphomicrobiales bacterium]MDE2113714.1 hypothetical protein [Hyphomicrobiales bacterium]
MKIPHLHSLDLARIAPLTIEQKRIELRRLKEGRPPYSYKPVRLSLPEILNVDAGPLGIVPRAPYEQVAKEIERQSTSEAEKNANLTLASTLYKYVDSNGLSGRRNEFFPLVIGTTVKVSYWVPAVVALDGRPTVLFIDPRRTKKLTEVSRRFVLSVMNQRIRVADPDYSEVELAIMQFNGDKKDKTLRIPKIHTAAGISLFDYDTINSMIKETYKILREVWVEREELQKRDTRRPTAGGFF